MYFPVSIRWIYVRNDVDRRGITTHRQIWCERCGASQDYRMPNRMHGYQMGAFKRKHSKCAKNASVRHA